MIDVLLTEHAFREYRDRLGRAGVPTRLIRVRKDGELVVDGVPPDVVPQPEVAWLTAEAFYDGVVVAFFDAVAAARTLRWLHSPAAGVDLPFFAGLAERGVRVTTSHVNAVPIAEYVLAAVLSHYLGLDEDDLFDRGLQ